MPCCAPRYGPLIVAAIDFCAGITGLILLFLGRDSKLLLVSITFPAAILPWLGLIIAVAFLKRNWALATLGFAGKIILIIGAVIEIILLLTHPELKGDSYTPVFIAALAYLIILQLHFSWVIHDFKSRRLMIQRSSQSLQYDMVH